MLDIDLKENYYALFVCIVLPVSIEKSLQMIVDEEFTQTQNTSITDADIEDMIRLRGEGLTNQAVGEMYGLSEEATYRRIKRYKERLVRKNGKT